MMLMVLSFHQLKLCVSIFVNCGKIHLDPELYLNSTHIPIIGEAKFIGLLCDSKLVIQSTHYFLEE